MKLIFGAPLVFLFIFAFAGAAFASGAAFLPTDFNSFLDLNVSSANGGVNLAAKCSAQLTADVNFYSSPGGALLAQTTVACTPSGAASSVTLPGSPASDSIVLAVGSISKYTSVCKPCTQRVNFVRSAPKQIVSVPDSAPLLVLFALACVVAVLFRGVPRR